MTQEGTKVVIAKENINALSIKEGVIYPFVGKNDRGLIVLNGKSKEVTIPFDKVAKQFTQRQETPKKGRPFHKPFSRRCEDAFRNYKIGGKKYTFKCLEHPTKKMIVQAYCRKHDCPAVISYNKAAEEKKPLPGPTAVVLYAKEDNNIRIRACLKCKKFEVYRESERAVKPTEAPVRTPNV